MRSKQLSRVCALVAGMMLVALAPAAAGTITVQWDPVSDTDLAGYRVYYGPTQGSHANNKDAGNSTSTTITAGDCAIHYVAVRAYDTGGLESSADSNSVRGYPRPIVSSLNSNTIRQGETKTFTVTGNNYDAGVSGDASRPRARVRTSNSGLTVTSMTVNSCGQITVTLQAASNAATGWATLYVDNPDITFSDPNNHPWIVGSLANAINVTSNADTTPPTVSSTNPAAGATNVAVSVRPTVTFSEAMLASSITSSTVQLIDANSVAVAQAAGSPSLSSDGRTATITPASNLQNSATYRIRVRGGSSGAKDAAGNALASDWTQSPGFTTAAASNAPTSVQSSSPSAGAQRIARNTRVVRITYNNDVSALWSSLSRAELQRAFGVSRLGRMLSQTSTSPSYENGGKTVVITLSTGLQAYATYRTQAGPVPQKGLDALRSKGVDPGVLTRLWYTSPGWTTSSAVTAAYSRDTASATQTTTALTIPEEPNTLPPENTDQPVTAEFILEFDTQVANQRLGGGIFRIVDERGAEVVQKARPRLENGGRNVVLTPATRLETGRRYKVVVRTGPTGVAFVESDGSLSTLAEPRSLVVPVATEVSGSSTEPGVAP